jgi:predicted DNA-binding ribbon-helix-helix protein
MTKDRDKSVLVNKHGDPIKRLTTILLEEDYKFLKDMARKRNSNVNQLISDLVNEYRRDEESKRTVAEFMLAIGANK